MYYVGCDLHKLTTWFYVTDQEGKRIISKSISNSIEELHKFFKKIPKPFTLAVEATYNWYFFVDLAREYAEEVFLADSFELKAFAKRHKKTDKIDAKLIADILRKGYLPIVTIADKNIRKSREMLNYRMNLVKDRTRNIARVKVVLDKLGEKTGIDLTTYKGIKELEIEHLPLEYQKIIKGYLSIIKELIGKIKIWEKEIKEKAILDIDTKNLMSISGISFYSALTIKTEIIDIHRFSNINKLFAYAGLAPKVHKSANKTIIGSLAKNRRKKLRWILMEIVQHFITSEAERSEKFERMKNKKGHNKAKIILARDMLRIIYSILKEKREYIRNLKEKRELLTV